MSAEFTKHEAIEFLGNIVQFKKRWSEKCTDKDSEYYNSESDYVDVNELARVDFIEDNNGLISLTLTSDCELRSFNKATFEEYCTLLKPKSNDSFSFPTFENLNEGRLISQ